MTDVGPQRRRRPALVWRGLAAAAFAVGLVLSADAVAGEPADGPASSLEAPVGTPPTPDDSEAAPPDGPPQGPEEAPSAPGPGGEAVPPDAGEPVVAPGDDGEAPPDAPSAGSTPAAPPPAAPPPADPPARRRPKVTFTPSGHTKGFFLLGLPVSIDAPPLPEQRPSVQGVLDARLDLALNVGRFFRAEAAHAITAFAGQQQGLGGVVSTGVGQQAPEAVTLSWKAFDEDGTVDVRGRTDRLLVMFRVPHLDVTVGRQPVTFGTGLFFTPLDLINPFTPTNIDTEVKPGVDAVRVDGYFGTSGRVTAVAAYQGAWDERGVSAALYGQGTVGVTDLAGMYAYVRGDHVLGLSLVSGVGPVGLHGDVAVTLPPDDERPFARAVFGVDGMPTDGTSLGGELYVQTLGSTDPIVAFGKLDDPRWTRGELWLTGVAYYGLSVRQEIVPTLHIGLGVIGSLTEASALLTPSLSWSVADNADFGVGGFVGLGARPDGEGPVLTTDLEGVAEAIGVRSEMGIYGGTVFAQLRAYF